MRRLFWPLWFVALLACLTPVGAYWQSRDSNYNVNIVSGGGFTPSCTQSSNFIARTSGLDTTHKTAVDTLICGRVTSGVFAKLDVWYVFATNSSANALLNLISSSFNGTANGSPTFTVDNGFTGTDASTTIFINTNFNPTTATTPNYVQNAAHVSVWSNTNATASASGGITIGLQSAANSQTGIFAKYSDGNAYFRINDINGGPSAGIANANSTGHYLANRSLANAQQGYKNAVSQGVSAVSSAAPANGNIFVLATDQVGTGTTFGSALQIMMATIGGNLSGADVTDLCHASNVYLNTIAGIAAGAC